MKWMVVLIMLLALLAPAGAQSAYEDGIKLLKNDQPEAARQKFEDALLTDPRNENACLYLGAVYEMLGNLPKALSVYQNGLLVAKNLKDKFYYNIGVLYLKTGDYTLAEKNFTLAVAENSLYPRPYLNRADTRMELANYKGAIEDYRVYLRLQSDTPQRPKIEQLIALLTEGIEGQEKLLQSVLNSLKNASTDTKTDAAGIEGFKDTGTKEPDILN